jgi:glucose/arabinose dehydrogenase
MRPPRLVLLAVLALAVSGCQKQSPPTPTPNPSPGGVETIRGTERLGWDQSAADTAELATFRYAVYVDGTRAEMADTVCGTTASTNGFACSGRLPALSPGQHTLELVAFTSEGDTTSESPRSAPLRVNVTAMVAGAQAGSLRAGPVGTTSDGIPLRLDIVLDGLDEPSDIAFAPDGRLFIAEREGIVRIVDGHGQSTTQLEGEILAFALDPAFERTGHLFVVEATDTTLVARYREINGTLGERMVLLHGVAARDDRPAAAIGIGPDGKLYVALDDGGDARAASLAGSLNGTLLRLNPDGTTPEDAPRAGMPIISRGYRSPQAIAWGPGDVLWIADGAPRVPERLSAIFARPRETRSARQPAYALAPNTEPSDAVVYRGRLFPAFQENLFVAAEAGHLLRIVLDPRAPTRVAGTERLLEGIGPVRAVAVHSNGAIYLATHAAVARVTPDGR